MRRTLLLITLAAGFGAQAQDMCGTIAERCEKHIAAQYIVDKDGNVLFTNKDHFNAPYWDLAVTNTIDVKMEASLDPSKAGSGCAVMLIGFKK